ncbi:MAG: radical SAM protein [Candidatus Omnitrophota bacterium]
MFNKVLLVNAEYPTSLHKFLNLHTGLGYISECLDNAGIENEIYEPALGNGYSGLRKSILNFKPDLIGYSMMSFRYKYNYEIIAKIKNEFSSLTIAAGGPHITAFGKKALLDCHAIDIGIMMEGEEILPEICKGKSLDEIAGIIYRKENRDIIQTQPRDLIEDLDKMPFPRYKRFNIDAYPKIIPIVTSRGCPYQCIFCPIGSVMGKRFRARSAYSVGDEIEFWHKKGFRDFSIADDAFNFIEKRVCDICDEIEKRKLSGIRISCGNGIRADKLDNQLLKRMKEAGFYHLAFGVESASNKVLGILKKGETIEKIEESIKEACRIGFWVELFFLIGSPGETWADVEESIKFALRYPIYRADFYNLIPFPDTELYRWAEERNCFIFPHPQYLDTIMHHVNKPLFATPELTIQERKKAFRYARKIVHNHTRKRRLKLDRWLTKEKLRDYYGIKGITADFLTWLYHHRLSAGLMRLIQKLLRIC